METPLTDIIGSLAALMLVLGYLPQTIHTIKTRSTDDIATGTFLLLGLGSLLFAIQGYMLNNYPLLFVKLFTTIMSSIIFGIKIHNDYFRKNKN
ncbi:MAG: PQ-loop domain-containing transporter [Flavobacteriales bacterium]|nr:PQ-loop domain-containing transporter [Flavobacteriales bacterium]